MTRYTRQEAIDAYGSPCDGIAVELACRHTYRLDRDISGVTYLRCSRCGKIVTSDEAESLEEDWRMEP